MPMTPRQIQQDQQGLFSYLAYFHFIFLFPTRHTPEFRDFLSHQAHGAGLTRIRTVLQRAFRFRGVLSSLHVVSHAVFTKHLS